MVRSVKALQHLGDPEVAGVVDGGLSRLVNPWRRCRWTSSARAHRTHPHTRRYRITPRGLQHGLLFTHTHDHLLRTGLAQLTDPTPPVPPRLRAAARAYQAAYDDLTRQAHLAA